MTDSTPATAAPVTWEMVYRFQAADDAQADRLAHAWAGTINAEFGCELVEARKVAGITSDSARSVRRD